MPPPVVNPTQHNWLDNSVAFNTSASLTLPHGVDTAIEFAHIPVFPTAFNFAGSFSIHAWIKPSTTALIRSRIIQTNARNVGGVTMAFTMGLFGDETFYGTDFNALRVGFGIDASGTQTNMVTSEAVLRPDTWHHVICQRTNGLTDIEIWVDGLQQDIIPHKDITYTAATNTGGTDPIGLVVGWDPNLEAPYKGNITDLAVFKRSLLPDEIRTLALGPCCMTNSTSGLTVDLVAWWLMGDADVVGLATLHDETTNDYHLTTVNMSAANLSTDVAREHTPIHNDSHVTTGSDDLQVDPNSVKTPFIWDSFPILDNPDSVPRGWFGSKQATDKFERVNVAGRLSVLRLAKATTGNGMFMTNTATDATGNTLTFGNPAHPDPTEYCLETVVRNSGQSDLYIGFVEDPHSFTTANPATGVFLHWDSNAATVVLTVSDATNTTTSSTFAVTDDVFYRLKLRFAYYPDLVEAASLRAQLYVNNVLQKTVTVLSNSTSYPVGTGEVFVGTKTSVGAYHVDMSWINVTFRGIGADAVLSI